MENIRNVIMEIGAFQLAANLSEVRESPEIQLLAYGNMPLPGNNVSARIDAIASWLIGFGRHQLIFLSPEGALASAMHRLAPHAELELFYIVPPAMDAEIKERIKNNLPKGGKVNVLNDYDSLDRFFPRNTIRVISGYLGGDRLMIPGDMYRLIDQHSREFYGRKVFVPYVELDAAVRYNGWIELDRERVNDVWRAE